MSKVIGYFKVRGGSFVWIVCRTCANRYMRSQGERLRSSQRFEATTCGECCKPIKGRGR